MIDFHAHLGKLWRRREPLTVEWLIAFMDANGIEKACVQPLVAPEEEDYYYTTEDALADCARHPDRLVPFANMDPRRGANDGSYDFYPVLKDYADAGCRGFGEILANLETNDPRMKGIYRACGRLASEGRAGSFPVVFDFRLTTTGVTDPVGMPYLEECLREFPETTFIGHGPGWWADISSDATPEDKNRYPTGPIKPPGAIDRLLEQYPNLHADLSAMSAYNALTRDPVYGREFLVKHHRKLIFGTDECLCSMKIPILDLIRSLDLPAPAQRAILHTNAAAMLAI